MATLTIHSCLPSLSTIDGHVCSRPCVVVSLLSSKQRLLSSRGPSLLLRRSSQRKGLAAPRASLGQLPGPEHVDLAVNALSQAPEALQGALTRAEGLFFTLADATAAVDASQVTDAVQKQDGGWLGGITNTLELALTVTFWNGCSLWLQEICMCWCRYFAYRKLLLVIGAIFFSKRTLCTYQGKMFKRIFLGCTNIKI